LQQFARASHHHVSGAFVEALDTALFIAVHIKVDVCHAPPVVERLHIQFAQHTLFHGG
jgi:hypothetical protein